MNCVIQASPAASTRSAASAHRFSSAWFESDQNRSVKVLRLLSAPQSVPVWAFKLRACSGCAPAPALAERARAFCQVGHGDAERDASQRLFSTESASPSGSTFRSVSICMMQQRGNSVSAEPEPGLWNGRTETESEIMSFCPAGRRRNNVATFSSRVFGCRRKKWQKFAFIFKCIHKTI